MEALSRAQVQKPKEMKGLFVDVAATHLTESNLIPETSLPLSKLPSVGIPMQSLHHSIKAQHKATSTIKAAHTSPANTARL